MEVTMNKRERIRELLKGLPLSDIPPIYIDQEGNSLHTYIIEVTDTPDKAVIDRLFDKVSSYLSAYAEENGWPDNEGSLYTACIYYTGDAPWNIPLIYNIGAKDEQFVLIRPLS